MATTGVALLICDMQNDIADLHGRDNHLKELVGSIKRLADWARASKVPVIYTRVCYRPSYVDGMPRAAHFIEARNLLNETQRGSAVIDDLAPQKSDIDLVRRRVSCFYGTDFDVVLNGLKTHTILLAGMSTARVVESAAREGSDRDYRMVVVSDACSADTREKHENALKSIADFFGEVMTIDQVKKTFA